MRTLLVSLVLACLTVSALGAEPIDFNRDIKPILSDKCYACHGPDATQRQGGGEDGLRLDTKEGAFADLDGNFALVPGDLEASELIRRISSEDPDEVMPPSDHRKSLTKQEKRILADWVKQGAIWSQHWAYVAPERTSPPQRKLDRCDDPPETIATRIETGVRSDQTSPCSSRDTST